MAWNKKNIRVVLHGRSKCNDWTRSSSFSLCMDVAATLFQSSTVAFQFGISGPFWYAAGASIQMVLFGIFNQATKLQL
jgi:hypothetical protein